jgi:hypothetical protein
MYEVVYAADAAYSQRARSLQPPHRVTVPALWPTLHASAQHCTRCVACSLTRRFSTQLFVTCADCDKNVTPQKASGYTGARTAIRTTSACAIASTAQRSRAWSKLLAPPVEPSSSQISTIHCGMT